MPAFVSLYSTRVESVPKLLADTIKTRATNTLSRIDKWAGRVRTRGTDSDVTALCLPRNDGIGQARRLFLGNFTALHVGNGDHGSRLCPDG